MPASKNIAELRSYLGSLNYYGKFIKIIKELREPLDNLLKKNVEFVWDQACEAAIEKTKKILCSDLNLVHFDRSYQLLCLPTHSNMESELLFVTKC